jgi:hypothetical protein
MLDLSVRAIVAIEAILPFGDSASGRKCLCFKMLRFVDGVAQNPFVVRL